MRGKKKGFTLVELIVVIAIIAIIAAVAVPTTIKYVNEAKVSMAENETLNLMNTITESMAMIATDKNGRLAKEVMLEVLRDQMPDTEYVTQVIVEQNGDSEFKVIVKAGDLAIKESKFAYSTFNIEWGEESSTSFSFVPSETESGWAVE